VLRGNTGPNTFSNIYHRGTGLFQIGTQDGAPMMLITSGQERLTISGNGSTIVNGNLRVQGDLTVNGSMNISNVSDQLAANSGMPINVYTNMASVSLTSGTWLVNTCLTAQRSGANATADTLFCKVLDTTAPTTAYASASISRPALAQMIGQLATTSIINLTSTKTITLQAKATQASSGLALTEASGQGATQITAIKIS
jgi:hypothetical protein